MRKAGEKKVNNLIEVITIQGNETLCKNDE